MMKRINYLFVASIITFLWITPLAYMLVDNQPPYEYDVSRSYVIPAKVPQQNQVTVHWHISRVHRLCPGRVTRIIVDASTGVRTVYDPVPAVLPLDPLTKEMALDRTFVLPPNLTPGLHYYKTINEFSCNLLQRFWPLTVATPEIPFEVLER